LVDIHSHVLYGVDDGSKTLEQSIEMLKMAVAAGTTELVCTPHANRDFKFEPLVIRERLHELEAGIGGALRLYTGCDFHLSYENIQDAITHPCKYTINQDRYLLVEFSELMIFRNTAEIFGRLQEVGMIPIITHPERNQLLTMRIEEIAMWVESGAYVQVTGQSLLGKFGKKAAEFARALLDRRLVHFIASDGHDLKYRPPTMNEAHAWLVKNYGQPMADALCIDNPRATLNGHSVNLPHMEAEISPPRKWYQIWR
jgi:protein-tyrosine phosphatase